LCLAVGLAVAAVVLLAVGPLGWRAGWWHFDSPSVADAMGRLLRAGGDGGAQLALALAGALSRRQVAIAVAAFLIGGGIATYLGDMIRCGACCRTTSPPISTTACMSR
jgi:hypothetical protein